VNRCAEDHAAPLVALGEEGEQPLHLVAALQAEREQVSPRSTNAPSHSAGCCLATAVGKCAVERRERLVARQPRAAQVALDALAATAMVRRRSSRA